MEETVRVADRIFDILEALAASNSPLGLSEIAKATGMSKSTVNRHHLHKIQKEKEAAR